MRVFLILFLLILFFRSEGQSSPWKRISLSDAVSLAFLNHTDQNTEDARKIMAGNVKKTYFRLVYEVNKTSVIQEQAGLMKNMVSVADLRYEAGDIDVIEKNQMISRFAEINTSLSRMEDDLSISRNNLKILLLVKDDLMPADSVLEMYALKKNDHPVSKPDSTAQFVHERKRENLESELNNYFKQLQYYSHVGLVKAEQLLGINRMKFENEDIDYTEYVEKTGEAFQIRLDYLETLNNYNQTAIQLEYHAY